MNRDRYGEIPVGLAKELEESVQGSIRNQRQDQEEEKKETGAIEVRNDPHSARLPSPDITDGHINTMPAISVDYCFEERRMKKFRTLSKSSNNVQAVTDIKVTSRLSELNADLQRHFSCDNNARNQRYMDDLRERLPDEHQILTEKL